MKNKSVILAVYKAALIKLQDCRDISADITGCLAASMRDLREAVESGRPALPEHVAYCARALTRYSTFLKVDARTEVEALRAVSEPEPTYLPGVSGNYFSTELSPLEQRVARIEQRENELAELFRQISSLEAKRESRADFLRETQTSVRRTRLHLRNVGMPGTAAALRVPFLKDDPEYSRLNREISQLYASVRNIRSTPL